jgi:hypothetical protein
METARSTVMPAVTIDKKISAHATRRMRDGGIGRTGFRLSRIFARIRCNSRSDGAGTSSLWLSTLTRLLQRVHPMKCSRAPGGGPELAANEPISASMSLQVTMHSLRFQFIPSLAQSEM